MAMMRGRLAQSVTNTGALGIPRSVLLLFVRFMAGYLMRKGRDCPAKAGRPRRRPKGNGTLTSRVCSMVGRTHRAVED